VVAIKFSDALRPYTRSGYNEFEWTGNSPTSLPNPREMQSAAKARVSSVARPSTIQRPNSSVHSTPRLTRVSRCAELFGMHLLNVALFDLLHQVRPMKQIALSLSHNFSRHDRELVVNHFAPDNRAARRNEMCPPLKDERQIPHDEQCSR